MSEITVVNNPERSRYEVRVDGDVAGFARYVRHPSHLDFVHTEIGSRFEGRGLAGRLVKARSRTCGPPAGESSPRAPSWRHT